MAVTYNALDLLSWTNLMRPVELVKTGIPRVLPAEFWTVTEEVMGDRAKVVEYTGTRRVARVNPYGSPARLVEKVGVSDRNVILLNSTEEMQYTDELYRVLRQWGSYAPQQKWAMDQIAQQGELFVQRQTNLETAAVTAMLANGVLWFDSSGNLLSSSSGASLTVDYQIPANNKNQLNGLIAADWSTTTTDIVGQINAIKVRAVQTTGYPLRYAFYGQNIPGYFNKNTSIQNYWWRNPQFSASYLDTGRMPPGMLELEWVPVQNAFYEDSSGSVVQIFGGDTVTFTPDINATTYAMYHGSQFVPTRFDFFPNAEAVHASAREVYGMYRYAKVLDNPYRIVEIDGNTFLPRFKIPNSIYIADVTP